MDETKYKQTEVGLIPEEWECRSIGEVGNTYAGLTGKSKQDFVKGNALYITFLNVLNNPILKPELFESVYVGVNERQNKAQRGDLFFNTSSETPEEVGICAMLDEDFRNLYLNSFCFGYRLKDNYIIPLFLSYYFRSDMGRRMMTAAAQGVTRYNLSKSTFNKIKIPLPPLAEQRAIASALTAIDNLIASLDKQIAKTQSVKQGAMQQLLTGKTRLKGFSEPWGTYKIDDLFDIVNGYTPSKANPLYWNNGTIPWFRLEDIRKNGRILNDSIQHITPLAIKSGKLFPPGSYILSTTATIGEHALITVASLANQQFSILLKKPNRKDVIDTIYFFYYLYIIGDWCRNNINAGGLNAVNIEDLKNYELVVPSSLAEQHAIASTLTAIDDQISALEAKRKKYQMVKVGMMQQLLTGKIRLK